MHQIVEFTRGPGLKTPSSFSDLPVLDIATVELAEVGMARTSNQKALERNRAATTNMTDLAKDGKDAITPNGVDNAVNDQWIEPKAR